MSDAIAHGIDYAWAQIPSSAIKAAGCSFVWRYLGGSARLTDVERRNHHANGLAVLLVWEQEADAAEKGYPRGVQAARNANAEADALGYPHDALIVYADDKNDPSVGEEVDFMRGVKSVGGRPSDMYSGGNVLAELVRQGLSPYGGVCVETWFRGYGEDPFMEQLANTRAPIYMPGIAEGDYDTDLLYRPVPMWGSDGSTTLGDDDMPLNDDDLTKIGLKMLEYHNRFVAPLKFVDGSEASLMTWIGAALKVQAAGGAEALAKAVVAALPKGEGGGLTKADVEDALRSVLHSV